MGWCSRLALCLAAFPAAAPAQTADAPITCIYRGVDGPTLFLFGEEPGTDAHRSARRTVLAVIADCSRRHGWSSSAAQQALRYAFGLRFEERAGARLRPFGLDSSLLAQVADGLTEEERASLLRGETDAAYAIALALVNSGRVRLEDLTVEESRRLGWIVGEGVAGLLYQRDAAEQFGDPQ